MRKLEKIVDHICDGIEFVFTFFAERWWARYILVFVLGAIARDVVGRVG